jgi:heme/copper-type cytochrome/quinol oxidase subunit 2
MAQNHTSEKSPLLWTIIPISILLTLLFVSVNNNTVAPKAQKAGDFSDVKVELKDTTATAGDTTHTAASADTTAHSAGH